MHLNVFIWIPGTKIRLLEDFPLVGELYSGNTFSMCAAKYIPVYTSNKRHIANDCQKEHLLSLSIVLISRLRTSPLQNICVLLFTVSVSTTVSENIYDPLSSRQRRPNSTSFDMV